MAPRLRARVVQGVNPGQNRNHNRRVVLDVLRGQGPAGRSRIAEMTGLSPQAITQIMEELVADGLVEARGRLRSGRGQPPIQFALNRNGPMSVGVEIAADYLTLLLTDLTGAVRAAVERPLTATDPDAILPVLRDELARLRPEDGTTAQIMGLGVVMPGPFDVDQLSARGPATLPGWSRRDPAAVLSEGLGLPVQVQNDATAAAVGERLYGAGLQLNSFCLLYLSTGLGLGIILNGQPAAGAHGNAGEIGHLIAVPGGRPCSCGQQGCLEQYASLMGLAAAFRRVGRSMPAPEALDPDCPVLDTWLGEAAACLRPMVATLENILDPQCLILAGALPDRVTDALIARMEPLPVSVAARAGRALPRLIRGTTGRRTAALGAAALPLMEALTPTLRHRIPEPTGVPDDRP